MIGNESSLVRGNVSSCNLARIVEGVPWPSLVVRRRPEPVKASHGLKGVVEAPYGVAM